MSDKTPIKAAAIQLNALYHKWEKNGRLTSDIFKILAIVFSCPKLWLTKFKQCLVYLNNIINFM